MPELSEVTGVAGVVTKKPRKQRKKPEGMRLSVVLTQAQYDLFIAKAKAGFRSVENELLMMISLHLHAPSAGPQGEGISQ
ncbi:MAG: hypothetical protein HQL75_00495 [Magnetococcales bacterium]|nr:hypothetical protein [Magnetococcales bacterium]